MSADGCGTIGNVPSQVQKRRDERNAEKKAAILTALRDGASTAEAAEEAGVGRTTAWRWRQEDEAFALAWHDAEEHGTDKLVGVARKRAVDGSDVLLMFLIKARRPEYRDRVQVDSTVKHVVPRDEAAMLQQIAANDPELASRLAHAAAQLAIGPGTP